MTRKTSVQESMTRSLHIMVLSTYILMQDPRQEHWIHWRDRCTHVINFPYHNWAKALWPVSRPNWTAQAEAWLQGCGLHTDGWRLVAAGRAGKYGRISWSNRKGSSDQIVASIWHFLPCLLLAQETHRICGLQRTWLLKPRNPEEDRSCQLYRAVTEELMAFLCAECYSAI